MSNDSFLASYIEALRLESPPNAFVDLDHFDENVKTLAQKVENRPLQIRIATKSLRVPELIRRVLDYGPPFSGLMCYSAKEALFLSEYGLDDFLIAYPTLDPKDLLSLRTLHEKGKKVYLVVDSQKGLDALNEVMQGCEKAFSFIIEVDMSLHFGKKLHLGVRRSPIHTSDDVIALVKYTQQKCPFLHFKGLMGYEAQVAGLPDRNPFKKWLNPVFSLIRKLSVRHVKRLREQIVSDLKNHSLTPSLVNAGGTGSLDFAKNEVGTVTELTAGSGFIASHLFDYYSNLSLKPAGFFALQVVRQASKHWFTLQGGGYIASGEPGWDRLPKPVWPSKLTLNNNEGCGEVQTPVYSPREKLNLGDKVIMRHCKSGELAERFNEYLLIQKGVIKRRVKTYRGHGKCFF